MLVTIKQEELLKRFNRLGIIKNELHKKLVKVERKRVCPYNDIEIYLDNEVYWVVVTPQIRHSSGSEYSVSFKFEIKKDSKYNETLYEFER